MRKKTSVSAELKEKDAEFKDFFDRHIKTVGEKDARIAELEQRVVQLKVQLGKLVAAMGGYMTARATLTTVANDAQQEARRDG
jgi:hypothetical protein